MSVHAALRAKGRQLCYLDNLLQLIQIARWSHVLVYVLTYILLFLLFYLSSLEPWTFPICLFVANKMEEITRKNWISCSLGLDCLFNNSWYCSLFLSCWQFISVLSFLCSCVWDEYNTEWSFGFIQWTFIYTLLFLLFLLLPLFFGFYFFLKMLDSCRCILHREVLCDLWLRCFNLQMYSWGKCQPLHWGDWHRLYSLNSFISFSNYNWQIILMA